jgi:hypothetical protein
MVTKKYFDLTINQILELAGGDLDQLASRLARRLAFDVKKRAHGGLSVDEDNDLDGVAYVTDKELGGPR